MYKNNFVMCLIHNGNIIHEETNRIVKLPFDSEFSVRLINKHFRRAKCSLSVNGENVGSFILNGKETIDIERFIDGNLGNGKKFVFASLDDSRTKDKTSFENGIVEANFYLEKELKIHELHHYYYDYFYPQYRWNIYDDIKRPRDLLLLLFGIL